MEKKRIKLGFKYFPEGFNPEDNFFTNLLREMYAVEISNTPDYLFYSVYLEKGATKNLSKKGNFIKKISPSLYIFLRNIYSKITNFSIKNRFPLPPGKYTKIFFCSEHMKPNFKKCDWAIGTYFEDEINNKRYMRLFNVVNDWQLKNFGIPPMNKEVDFEKIKKEKTKFCNFIYSQDIPKRNNFFSLLNEYKKIDAPGRCMNNMPPINSSDPKKSRLSKIWVEEKLDFIKDYKFTISYENKVERGYITEKLTHPMLVNSIPIYVGDKSVSEQYNTKSFINRNDFKNDREFINYIIKVDNDDKLYESILRQPWYKDNQLPGEFDIKKIKNKFRQIFG